jgi:hypothetical protein
MIRALYIFGGVASVAACAVLVRCADRPPPAGPQLAVVLNDPGAVERFRQDPNDRYSLDRQAPPLIVQAEALARYLTPPKGVEKPAPPAPMASSRPPELAIRPVAPSVRFRLCATSYYPNQPGKSMALIGELGSGRGSERWVREGAQVGHFVIHEIRRGAIVYRDGDNLREMAVEHGASLPSIVRDLRPGSIRVSAAVGGTDSVTPALAGPNGIEIAGGN